MPALDQAENGLSPTLAREHTKLACRMNLTMLAAVTDRVSKARARRPVRTRIGPMLCGPRCRLM
jgi:hypothetical protein